MSKCDVHITEAITDRKELETIIKKLQDEMKDAPPEILALKREKIRMASEMLTEQSIRGSYQRIMDTITIAEKTRRWTHDPLTGQMYKNRLEAVQGRLKSLVGRNGMDTKMRTIKNSQIATHAQMELIFGNQQNPTYKTLGDVPPDSDVERELYKRVYQLEEEITPEMLRDPAKLKGLMNKYGKDEIGRLALALQASNGYARQLLGRYGVSVKFAKNYVMKRRYDWAKLETMDPTSFADYMSKRLDLHQTFGTTDEAYAKRQLEKIFVELEKEKSIEQSVLSNDEFTSTSANSIARKFVYKDADAAYDAFKDLSSGGMADQFLKNVRSVSATAVRVSEFGYNPESVMKKVQENIDNAFPKYATGTDEIRTKWAEAQIKLAQADLTGQSNLIKGGLTTFSNSVRFAMAFGKLGNALPTAFMDMLDNNRQVFYMNGELFGGIREYVRNTVNVWAKLDKAQRIEVANMLGMAQSYTINGEAMRMGDMGSGNGGIGAFLDRHGSRMMNWATLLPEQTSRSQIVSALNAADTFTRMIDEHAAGKTNKFAKDTFAEYEFTKQELDLLASGAVKKLDTWGNSILTPTAFRDLLEMGPEKLGAALGVEPVQAGEALLRFTDKYQRLIDDFVVRGTPTPEMATKTVMFKNIENEPLRVAISLSTQFMDTPIAQLQNGMELVKKINRVFDGNRMDMAKAISGHAAVYVPMGVASYLATEAIFAAALGKESRLDKYMKGNAEERRMILMNAVNRTSFVPFAGEFLANQFSGRYNQTGMDAFGSPAFSAMRDTLMVMKPEDMGGMPLEKYLYRQLPTNALPVQFVKNWAERAGVNTWKETTEAPFSGFR